MDRKSLVAKSARQIDLALKIVFDNRVAFAVNFEEQESGKLWYIVDLYVDDDTYRRIERTYRNFIL